MKFIKYKESIVHRNSDSCIVREYPFGEDTIEVGVFLEKGDSILIEPKETFFGREILLSSCLVAPRGVQNNIN